MFRRATFIAVRTSSQSFHSSSSTISLNSNVKLLTLLNNKNSFNFLVLARNQSTSGFDTKVPTATLDIAETTAPIFTKISDSTPELIANLAANGEPTFTSLGLASWWPSGIVQSCLEFLHCGVGLPWWGAIAVGTVVIRLALFPLIIKSQRSAAHMQKHMPQMHVIQQKIVAANAAGDKYNAALYNQELMDFMMKNNVNPFKQMVVPLTMGSVFCSCFFGLRGMASLPVESLKTGGLAWFTDLTVSDPNFILPMFTSATLYLTLKTGADSGGMVMSPQHEKIFKMVLPILPVITFAFTNSFPAALLCYWGYSNMFSLIQVKFLLIPQVREFFKIPPIPKKPKTPAAETTGSGAKPKGKGFFKDLQETMNNAKLAAKIQERQKFEEQAAKRTGQAPVYRRPDDDKIVNLKSDEDVKAKEKTRRSS